MQRNLVRALRALAITAGLGASATGLSAQKALVYCPVGIDATGCSSAAAALGGSFPGGVDRGYDGTAGTLDLRTADFAGYALVVVPSLSDNPGKAPYALLRTPGVAERLAAVLNGRVAVWSGTPDQGKGNREAKNALLRNLAAHAVGDGGGPALLVLQDASAAVSERYGWLAGISGRSISARPGARVFGFARGLSTAGSRVLDGGGSRLAFGNMASFGLVLPDGSDWTADVEGSDAPVAYGGSALPSHGAASAADALAGRLRALWARMFAAYNVVLATSPGTGGGSARPALTLSVSPDSVIGLVAGAASANLRANLSASGNCNAANLANVKVNFSITPTLNQNNTSLSSGEASWNGANVSSLTLGTSHPVTAASTASGNCTANTATGAIRVKKGTALLDVSAAGGGVGASTTLQARLVDRSPAPGNAGIQGATLSFTVGTGTFTASTVGNGTATAAGTLPAAPGTYKVYVRYAGTEAPGFYMAAVDSSQSVTVTSAAATGLVVAAATGQYGGTAGLSATLTSGGSPVSGRTVGFTLNGTAVCGGGTGVACPATNASGVASLAAVSLGGINAGTYGSGVGASFAGDGGYTASTATGSLTVGKAAQAALTLSGVPASAAFNSTFTVTPAGGSGSAPLVVTSAGVCTAAGNAVTMIGGTGTCTVKLNRAGDDNYDAAAEVTASATASKLNQGPLSISGVPASAPFNATFAVVPGGGSGSASLVVTTAGVCSVSGNSVTMTSGTGSCTVKVNRAGDDNYDAAAEVTASAAASKLSQAALSLSGVPASAPFNSTFAVVPTGGSGSASLVVTAAGVCSASGNSVTMTSGTGTCTVKVNRAGDDNYDAAAEVTASATASKLNQAVLTLSGVPSSAPFNSTFTVTPGGGSGSASLVVTATGVCSASGNDVTMTSGTGTCTVRVNRAGDDDHNAAAEVSAAATASKLNQTALSLMGVPASAPFNSSFTVTPGGGSSSAALVVTTAGVCTTSGNDVTMTSGTGTCTVKVNRAGDGNFNAASEVTASATASKLNQPVLSLSGVPASAPFNSTFGVTPGGGGGSAALVVTTAGVCSASGNNVTMTSGTGTCTVKVNRAGDDDYNAASEVTATAIASKLNQAVLSLSGVPASAPYNSTFTVTPGGGSGSASPVVTTTGVCSASGNQVTMTSGTGTCTVRVNRAGDDDYNAAAEVSVAATASKLNQAALSVMGVPASAPFNSSFTVAPGGGSSSAGLVVTTAGVCTASGNQVTMTSGTGTCTVKLNRAGDDNYAAASEVTAAAAAARIGQAALAVTSPTAGTFGQKYAPAAVGGSGTGAVSFGVGASTACAIVASGPDAGKVEITGGTGTCEVTASKAADADYEAASSPALPVALSKAAQTVTFAQPTSPQTFGASFTVNPTASSGLAVGVAAAGGCSVAPASPGYTVTMTSGTAACVLTASQAGNGDYLAAAAAAGSSLERTVAAAKAPATLAFTLALPAKTYGDPEFGVASFAAAGASGIAVTFSSTTPAVCTVTAAGQVQLLKSGSCTVRAAQAASADYAAGQVDQAFAVGKRAAAVEYTGDNYAATGGPTIGTATIRLSATVQRKDGGTLGDLGLARVRFTLTKQGGGSQTVFAMADASGSAMTTASVAADNDNQWQVQTTIDPDNAYWSGDFDIDPLQVVTGTTEKRATGGGWVADAQSANGKANFGFSVAYQKNGSPRGNLTYVYRGTDGYDYVVKSNSWQGGALTFDNRDASLAAFSGRATVQRIDRATGLADPTWAAGNYTFTVDGMDGDLRSPKVRDTFAITIMDSDGRIWRQLGTRTAPVQLGGGNVAVQSR